MYYLVEFGNIPRRPPALGLRTLLRVATVDTRLRVVCMEEDSETLLKARSAQQGEFAYIALCYSGLANTASGDSSIEF